jgi:hypothetical protein
MKKVFKVIFKSAPSVSIFLHVLFHPDEHHIKQSTELYGFRFDLCKEVFIVYDAQGILFVLLCRSSAWQAVYS